MQIQAIVLALVATTYATEKFLPSHAEVHAGGTTTEDWSYCPDENGCCSDGKTFYRCKNFCAAGSSCTIFATGSSC
ncbi:hypothetical protein PtrV1_00079 [Pyrenophora tritici-repentis]|uniref:Uncharacterized protein n=2 Tax=Pyrenophora tritici-repentis TaxID=45151 RepID=A0A5M9LPN4_9PLEO|nr:uncharacterized protein PTRG_11377 [Pyrenophora tritici-repentis Pt-1C-BFP]EDU44427.1 predicted protein [Pyrenophora tritici-repentis Pt-1C-BFP]KAA8624399.1 hypothetical protein PtrV1_00079 [Pyrenophora tritici-repentis]KAI1519704.1 hypothetical protein Ptr86124_000072 [Pyrenophora tritici-repentis]KAI1686917.1 hypothetical protein KJE20_00094 [Pyrenophora tritici-repentis]